MEREIMRIVTDKRPITSGAEKTSRIYTLERRDCYDFVNVILRKSYVRLGSKILI
ncbi:hypothetical protein SACC_28870 [Saccharolobus caldissimus]|uniref:Uncharacterized protein n=1 Tax=Saccharolobus caldissimus TaxID=1702097 RepID=A0AAQ4CVN9_9CREN|nr:hypothetical protein SACC_28870 [Saccharolobus caldissimus]